MTEQVTIIVHPIAEDGLPDMEQLVGRVAFIWDGAIVSGWPLHDDHGGGAFTYNGRWEASDDALSSVRYFTGVTHWVEFPEPIWDYQRCQPAAPSTPEGTPKNA